MSDTHPAPVGDLDASLAATLRRSERDRWVIIVVVLIVLGAVTWLGIRQLTDEHRAEHDIVTQLSRASAGECQFFASIGNTKPAANITRLGVQILEGSRAAFRDLNCAGELAPPSPELLHAGRQFGVAITY